LAGGRPVGRMNSASRGLRPTVGLRRPGRCLLRRRRPTPGAQRLGRPISIGVKACADREGVFCVGGGRRLAAPEGRFPAWRRPGGCLLRRRSAPGAQRPGRPISIGVKAFGRRSACADREGRCLLRRRRPTPGAERPEGRFQSAGRPSAWRSAGRRLARSASGRPISNEFGLQGPLADGRPAPTGKVSFASAEADAWRAAPWKADFNRREGLRPAVGLCAE
jgi:hypothetical protein